MEFIEIQYGVHTPYAKEVLPEQSNYLRHSLNYYLLKAENGKDYILSKAATSPQVMYALSKLKIGGTLALIESQVFEQTVAELEKRKPKPKAKPKTKSKTKVKPKTKPKAKKEPTATVEPVELLDSKEKEADEV